MAIVSENPNDLISQQSGSVFSETGLDIDFTQQNDDFTKNSSNGSRRSSELEYYRLELNKGKNIFLFNIKN